MDKSVLWEMQLKEALDRETNLKKLNESLMKAMNDISNQDKGKEIQLLNQLHEQEINKLKTTTTERITILEYDVLYPQFKLRNKCQELNKIEKDYKQLLQDYETLENVERKCYKCTELNLKIGQTIKQAEIEKEGLAREFAEALNNQKAIHEYDLNCQKLKIKQLMYELECEVNEKEKLNKSIKELSTSHEQAQRSLLQQIAELNKAHNETIVQNNAYQMNSQNREQAYASRCCSLEQDKIILEKNLQESKEIILKLETQLKGLCQEMSEKEQKLMEQKSELTKKLNNEKKIAEQCQAVALKLKNDFQRKQSLLIEESLKKEQQLKNVQTLLTRQKSKNKYYENALSHVNLLDLKNSTPKQIKHKKNNYSNDFNHSQQPGHTKVFEIQNQNTLSQGHATKKKLIPSSIQKSEADSIHFNLADMLNSTRNPDQQNLSCRQSNEDIGQSIEQFNFAAKFVEQFTNIRFKQMKIQLYHPRCQLTDKLPQELEVIQLLIIVQTVNPKGPPQRVRQIHADLYKENVKSKVS